jgi:hypothetical protein
VMSRTLGRFGFRAKLSFPHSRVRQVERKSD